MKELLTESPDSLPSFRQWVRRAADEISPRIEANSLGEFDLELLALIAGVIRRAKAHAFRLGLYDLADRLPERKYKTCLDGLLRLRECARWRIRRKRTSRLTPPQVAKRYGVSPDTVRLWISQGELQAVNISKAGTKRPRYRIEPESLAEFDRKRSAKVIPPTLPQKRRSRKRSGLLVTMFSGDGQ